VLALFERKIKVSFIKAWYKGENGKSDTAQKP
jgi:hypothetical protein